MANDTKAGDWKKRESFGSALTQIIIVGVILAAGVFFFYKRADTKKKVDELSKQARVEAIKGNPADLRKAFATIEAALAVDDKAPSPLSIGADIQTHLWLDHKEAGAEAKAKDLLSRAKAAEAKTDERFGSEALHMLAAGQAQAADDFVETQRKQGASSARLFYAQGLAQKAIGNLALANTGLRTAMDKAWKDPTFPTALGESIIESGAMGAADAYTKALNANAEHFGARLGMALVRIVKKDRVGDAEALIKDVLSKDAELTPPLKARAIALQANIANIAEQPDQAITLADQALGINGDEAWALFAKANALASKKDPGAAAAYDATLAKNKTAPIFYFEGAARLQKAGSVDAALALLDKYETLFKTVKNQTADGKEVAYLDRDDKYWLTRGDVLHEAGKDDDALKAYDKAIDAKSVNISKAYLAKGALYVAKKEYDKATEVLADITPPDGTGLLPEAYMAMGEVGFAKKDWQAGCQSYAYGLSRMKMMQVPRETLNGIITDVEKKLIAAGQKPIAKVWMEEAKPIIQ